LNKDIIELNFIDHVAIRVRDKEESINWYSSVLGLKKVTTSKWGEYPVFMMSKKFGVALFPANSNDAILDPKSNNVKIDHFAFNVNQENFQKAIKKYEALGLTFEQKDHHYFESIYTKDPDGHIVELTRIKIREEDFYQ